MVQVPMFLSVFLNRAAPLLKRLTRSLENLEDVAEKCRPPMALMGAHRPIAAGGRRKIMKNGFNRGGVID